MAIGSAPASRGTLLAIALLGSILSASQACADEVGRALRPPIQADKPRLSLRSLDGREVSLDADPGRVTLVHFFATWCEPCLPELASLDRLQAEAGPSGLRVLAVSVAEPEQRLERFFSSRPFRFTVLLDGDRAASRAWQIDALPSTIVLDAGGRPRLSARGDLDWQSPDVRAALHDLLDETGR